MLTYIVHFTYIKVLIHSVIYLFYSIYTYLNIFSECIYVWVCLLTYICHFFFHLHATVNVKQMWKLRLCRGKSTWAVTRLAVQSRVLNRDLCGPKVEIFVFLSHCLLELCCFWFHANIYTVNTVTVSHK